MNLDAVEVVDLALADLGSAINALDRAFREADATLEQRAHWLAALEPKRSQGDGLYRSLAIVIAGLKSQMASQMPYGQDVEVEGVGVLTYSSTGGSTKWNWSGIVPLLAAQVADEVVDPVDGSVPPRHAICEQAMHALGEVVSLTPSKSGKKGALKARNIDPAEYVTTTDSEPSVRFL